MKHLFLLVLGLFQFLNAQNIIISFFGILPGGSPDFEKGFERELREQLTVIPNTSMTDQHDIEYFKRKINFNESPIISRLFIENLFQTSNDKTLIIWGRINDYSLKPERKWLLGAKITGTLSTTLILYSLHFKDIVYLGDIVAKASINKPPVFFNRLDKTVSIDVTDRLQLYTILEQDITEQSISIVKGFARTLMANTGSIPEDKIKTQKVPSISDLFDIPTVEPSNIIRPSKINQDIEEQNIQKKDTIKEENETQEEQ